MSAYKGKVTSGGLTHQVSQYYYSTIVEVPGENRTQTTKYCFLARVDPWDNPNTPENEELTPPEPQLTEQYLKDVFKNMFVIKRVFPEDMRPMIRRFDWTAGEIYDYYQDNVDMLELDPETNQLEYNFYVKNSLDQVFKCLWNGATVSNPNGVPSIDEPIFEPGYIEGVIYYGPNDGYKWVYMYTIESFIKQKFLEDDWLPCPLANTAGFGSLVVNSGNVPVINVLEGGLGYSEDTKINITGANTRMATAVPVLGANGTIRDVIVTDPGFGYISANVEIVSSNGSGALLANVEVSPVNGHGSDPFEEFGSDHILVTQTFEGDEAGLIPDTIKYRQVGFIINPASVSEYFDDPPTQCQKPIYSLATEAIVSAGLDSGFVSDEIVYQGVSEIDYTFKAKCLDFDSANNKLRLINIEGTPQLDRTINGSLSSTSRTLFQIQSPDVIPFSGYITYIENREGTQRSPDGSEQIRLNVGFR
jgi:hypothetical protein